MGKLGEVLSHPGELLPLVSIRSLVWVCCGLGGGGGGGCGRGSHNQLDQLDHQLLFTAASSRAAQGLAKGSGQHVPLRWRRIRPSSHCVHASCHDDELFRSLSLQGCGHV